MESSDTVCFCFHVSKRKILNYLRQHRLRRASQLSECGGAGTGCGWCVPYLERYFAAANSGAEPVGELPAAEYERQREAYLRAGKVRENPTGQAPLPPADPSAAGD